jgi:G3E family GTPase
VEQIEFCNVIILNKSDLVSEEQIQELKTIVHTLQPSAQIIETSYGKVAPEEILNARRFNFEEACASPGWVQELRKAKAGDEECDEEYGINSFAYYRRQPFCQEELNQLLEQWPENIVRCKGLVWLAEQNNMSFLLEQAGKSIELSPFGRWLAAASKREQKDVLAKNPSVREDWDPDCGDRRNMLVLIGLHLNKEEISASLDACLSKKVRH